MLVTPMILVVMSLAAEIFFTGWRVSAKSAADEMVHSCSLFGVFNFFSSLITLHD